MARVPLKAVLKELERRKEIQFSDLEGWKRDLKKALIDLRNYLMPGLVHSPEYSRLEKMLPLLRAAFPKDYKVLQSKLVSMSKKLRPAIDEINEIIEKDLLKLQQKDR